MGNEGETNTRKPGYNISMSRRTRKQPQNDEEDKDKQMIIISRSENDKQKSLKQLIEGRCSLAQHFREEEAEKQQISAHVIVDHDDQDGFQGLSLKRSTVTNYVRVILSHLIKVKHESYIRSWRKRAQSLKLIEHKS